MASSYLDGQVNDRPVYPVVLCGGSGQRLWPSSTPAIPKQFLRLLGPRSLFQDTIQRTRDLALFGGEIVVVAGASQLGLVRRQLDEIACPAVILVEPAGRNSSPAISAAALWITNEASNGLAVVVPSDHHVPDVSAFHGAVQQALGAARHDLIVTLGVEPTGPATGYGYIRPGRTELSGVRTVEAFVEKPGAERAAQFLAAGYLWNSGNFIASAQLLVDEQQKHAPDVARATRLALAGSLIVEKVVCLGEAFVACPAISFDNAVMERTSRAAVLPVSFSWSDLGTWDAVWSASDRDGSGNAFPPNAWVSSSSDVLVRSASEVRVAVVGVQRVAVVVEPDGILVCGLDRVQDVKQAAEIFRSKVDPEPPGKELAARSEWFRSWLETGALPVWATLGFESATGLFHECLDQAGRAIDPFRRTRVQARQVLVFAAASADGRPGPWADVAVRGFARLQGFSRGTDGLYVESLTAEGLVRNATAYLYEQAFVLLAAAAMERANLGAGQAKPLAESLLKAVGAFRHKGRGFREIGDHPYQANAHMHLLEAALAWEALDSNGAWRSLADEIAELALTHFVDAESGTLHEFFGPDWSPLRGEAGLQEPGHHFEWACLLHRWSTSREHAAGRQMAEKLYRRGLLGVDFERSVAVNSTWDGQRVRDASARLWPQTEFLKAALILGSEHEALMACEGLCAYLNTQVRGLWFDRQQPDGSFTVDHAPASSFYHLYMAIAALGDVSAS